MRDARYILAYIAPLAAGLGVYFGGIWSLGSVYVAFFCIPLLEIFLPGTDRNLSPEQESNKAKSRFFDWLLYLNVPILYGLLGYYLREVSFQAHTWPERLALTLNLGVMVGTIGINVAHELGHRATAYEQRLSQVLLLSGLYMHFFIEHNRGHHKHVATDLDPASARKGEWIYTFWVRSVTGSYRHAWQLENKRLQKLGLPALHWKNQMLVFQGIQLAYLGGIYALFGPWGLLHAIGAAVVGFLLLESVNYIEHYGLRRQLQSNGQYEKVGPQHSWNSDHELGRIFLYELTRHSDHHYKASRKYQILRHWEESPQLPQGYPASILMALAPPLWFWRMDKKVGG